MKFATILFFYVLLNTFIIRKARYQETFSAVTSFHGLGQLYAKIRTKEKHSAPDTTIGIEQRKRICRSMTTSALFDLRYGEYAVDMDAVYAELKGLAKRERECKHPDRSFERVLEYYERDERTNDIFYTYRGTSIAVASVGDEFAFGCVTKIRINGLIHVYFISDAYNVNAALDLATEDHEEPIRARFVRFATLNKCRPMALAEEPATVFANSEHLVESIYLRLRKAYFVAHSPSHDPVCGLSGPEKLRVCATVLSSNNFAGSVQFVPDTDKLDEKCELNTVSFREDSAKSAAEGHFYREWMLSCRAQRITGDRTALTFFVSQAYQPHHVFVYSRHLVGWQWVWHIENISAKISVVVDKGLRLTKHGQEHPPPNMVDLRKSILRNNEYT